MQYILIVILSFSFSFSQSSTLWGCHDENAINFNPWTLWDCGDWCCEYENDLDLSIIINEINYNPASSFDQNDIDYEFIELYNLTDSDINLNGWYLNIEHSGCFTFPDILIGSNEYLILARNPETYPGSIGIGSDIFLSNTGSTITLRNLDYDIVDEVSYSDGCYDSTCLEACWPINSDAGGSTLELIDYELDNSLASSWQDSFIVPGGTPGYANSNNDGIVYGCTDLLSCNYDPIATVDNSSCIYSEENFDCGGNCTIEEDCAGECSGLAIED